MKVVSLADVINEFQIRQIECPTYRLGQFLCTLFIKETRDEFCDEEVVGLWEKDGNVALEQFLRAAEKYQWDTRYLPLLDRDEIHREYLAGIKKKLEEQ